MPIPRTPIIDDDGTGTSGTVIDNAWKQEFYNQIDTVLAPAWQVATPGTITDDVGNVLVTSYTSRTQRITPTTILWRFYMASVVTPVATPTIWLSFMPFSVAGLNQFNAVALHSFGGPAYIDAYSADRFRVKRVDQGNITASTHYFAFASLWEVL
jgi:hypothetical protein